MTCWIAGKTDDRRVGGRGQHRPDEPVAVEHQPVRHHAVRAAGVDRHGPVRPGDVADRNHPCRNDRVLSAVREQAQVTQGCGLPPHLGVIRQLAFEFGVLRRECVRAPLVTIGVRQRGRRPSDGTGDGAHTTLKRCEHASQRAPRAG